MGSLDLPSKDSPDLHLLVATDEELIAQRHANSSEWRGALSLDSYLRREILLYDQDLTRHGGITPWVLVYQPNADQPRQVVCGCETINKRALVARNGKIERVTCHDVGSVFCPPEYRGRGYAGRMMTDLGRKLRGWQMDEKQPVLFSVLYSDIGKDFYAARGWHPFPSAHVNISAASTSSTGTARLLRREDLAELCALDEKLLLAQLSDVATSKRSTVALIPDHQTIYWHHAREDFVSQELYGKSPDVRGALVGNAPGSRVWAFFTRVWVGPHEESPSTLHILRLVVEDASFSDLIPATEEAAEEVKNANIVRSIAAIFSVAQSEAAEWGMKEVVLWNPTAATLAAARSIDPNVVVVHRETESITSLQWYGSESSWQDVDWVCNEKYGWC